MWISKEESGIVSSTLRPKMEKTRRAHESLLDEAITLQVPPGLSCLQSCCHMLHDNLVPRPCIEPGCQHSAALDAACCLGATCYLPCAFAKVQQGPCHRQLQLSCTL